MHVLIVEDEALIALSFETAIVDAGHEIFGIAASVAQARKLLAAGTPDAAVLDIRLGRELSYPVAAVLKDRGVPFVFVTGYDNQTIDVALAPVTVLRKPVSQVDIGFALKAMSR